MLVLKARMLSIFCVLAVFFSLLSGITVSSAGNPSDKEFILNGGFEIWNGDGVPTKWSLSPGAGEFESDSVSKKSGGFSLRMLSESGNVYALQHITHMISGHKYTLGFWMSAKNYTESGPAVKFEYYKLGEGEKEEFIGDYSITVNPPQNGKWNHYTYEITPPDGTYAANILIRCWGSDADVNWDDVSFKGARLESYVEEAVVPEEGKKVTKIQYPYDENDSVELIKNGGLELTDTESGLPKNWILGKGSYGSEYLLDKKAPHGGSNSIRLIANGGHDLYISQEIYGLVGAAQYKLSSFVKTIDIAKGKVPLIKFEFYGIAETGGSVYLGEHYENFKEAKKDGTWEKWEFFITVPEEAVRANILFRLPAETGDLYFDDLSLTGADAKKYIRPVDPSTFPVPEIKPMAAGGRELIQNGGFEDVDGDGSPTGWTAYKSVWKGNPNITLEHDFVHSGSTAVKIATDEGGNPWVRYTLTDLKPFSEYQMSVWLSAPVINGNGVAFKFEYYKSNEITSGAFIDGKTSGYTSFLTGEHWYNFVQRFETPADTAAIVVYLRLYADGEVYFDDASCYMTKEPKIFDLSTNQVFYYTGTQIGTAEAAVNLYSYPDLESAAVDFALTDNGTILAQHTGTKVIDGAAKFKFYVDRLADKGKEYKIIASVKNDSGVVVEEKETPVYRYDRPSALSEDGAYIKDGKPFDPIFAYHVKTDYYSVVREGGINVVQASPDKATLDKALENGLMAIVALYPDMRPAGHPSNAENTRQKVKELMNHPAVFAWAIMDEPFANDPTCEPNLLNSYKLIRDIDPVHPIWIMEDGNGFGVASKYCDIYGIDPYPGNTAKKPTTYVQGMTSEALDETDYIKPVYTLLQAFTFNSYTPSRDEMRNMIYQSLFEGSKAIGYYEFDSSIKGASLNKTELWEPITSWYKNEARDAFDYFVHDRYKNFNEVRTDSFWAESYIKDGKIYMVVINREDKAPATAVIPLTSADGTVTVGDYSAVIHAGGQGNSFNGSGTLTVGLLPGQAVVYEITPAAPLDFSNCFYTKFDDLGSHLWAKPQIEKLERTGILYGISSNAYGPGKNITRGDFAAFLIRTLGLKADTANNFSDVEPTEKYAAEIAVGKALGVLNGVGDNRFDPDAEITRQDLMTICARGMRYANKLGNYDGTDNIKAYSDGALVSDYALSSVWAMIKEGIIKGNADGTLNPEGSATRAEAAVIMYRIFFQ